MKVKNIAFSGFMAAILMGATATAANAAISVASKDYVDTKSAAVASATIDTELADTGVIGSKIKAADDKAVAAQTAVDTLASNVYTKAQADDKFELIGVAAAKAEEVATKAEKFTNTKIQELSDKLVGGGEGGEVGLESKVASNTLAIDALEGRADTLDGLVGTTSVASQIATALQTAQGYADAAEADANAYTDGKVAALDGRVTANEGAINALNTKVGEKDVATQISEATSSLSSDTTDLKTRMSTAESGLSAVQELSATNEAAIETLDGAVAQNAQAISDMDTAYKAADTALQGNIDALSGTVTANKTETDTAINDINTELTKKIEMPAVCDKTTCVLTYDNTNDKPVWVPLTDPVAEFM